MAGRRDLLCICSPTCRRQRVERWNEGMVVVGDRQAVPFYRLGLGCPPSAANPLARSHREMHTEFFEVDPRAGYARCLISPLGLDYFMGAYATLVTNTASR